jgi:hypothetical protein
VGRAQAHNVQVNDAIVAAIAAVVAAIVDVTVEATAGIPVVAIDVAAAPRRRVERFAFPFPLAFSLPFTFPLPFAFPALLLRICERAFSCHRTCCCHFLFFLHEHLVVCSFALQNISVRRTEIELKNTRYATKISANIIGNINLLSCQLKEEYKYVDWFYDITI